MSHIIKQYFRNVYLPSLFIIYPSHFIYRTPIIWTIIQYRLLWNPKIHDLATFWGFLLVFYFAQVSWEEPTSRTYFYIRPCQQESSPSFLFIKNQMTIWNSLKSPVWLFPILPCNCITRCLNSDDWQFYQPQHKPLVHHKLQHSTNMWFTPNYNTNLRLCKLQHTTDLWFSLKLNTTLWSVSSFNPAQSLGSPQASTQHKPLIFLKLQHSTNLWSALSFNTTQTSG